MPFTEVLSKFKNHELYSGGKTGPQVKDRSQALAIMLSEKRQADAGDAEYKPQGLGGIKHK